jgi:hypothetical protein
VSFPKDDPNHYALYRLLIIARFCAPPFPDALVETSRQRPSPAPEISGRILALCVERAGECRTALPAQYAIPAGRRLRPGDQDSTSYNVLVANLAAPAKSVSRLVALLNSQPDILIWPLKREHDGMAR